MLPPCMPFVWWLKHTCFSTLRGHLLVNSLLLSQQNVGAPCCGLSFRCTMAVPHVDLDFHNMNKDDAVRMLQNMVAQHGFSAIPRQQETGFSRTPVAAGQQETGFSRTPVGAGQLPAPAPPIASHRGFGAIATSAQRYEIHTPDNPVAVMLPQARRRPTSADGRMQNHDSPLQAAETSIPGSTSWNVERP